MQLIPEDEFQSIIDELLDLSMCENGFFFCESIDLLLDRFVSRAEAPQSCALEECFDGFTDAGEGRLILEAES